MKSFFRKIALYLFGVSLGFVVYLSFPSIKTVKNTDAQEFQQSQNWHIDTLLAFKSYLRQSDNIDAFVATIDDEEIFSFGNTEQLINLHSMRKPIISLLFGIAIEKGMVDLSETLGELKITEEGKTLSQQELSATIEDLLMSKSGVYLEADAEIKSSKTNRPQRNQYKPGEHYFYNNFDFNVLATILKKKTGMPYEECLYKWLAKPLGMHEFQESNIKYGTPFSLKKTNHPAYKTWMSTRDLAKIGALLAQNGVWKGQQLVSKEWIKKSTTPHHKFSKNDFRWPMDSYGYLWHVDTENNTFWGSGYGGQYMMIDTVNHLSLVQRHYTGNSAISQGYYLVFKNTQSSQVDLMNIWYRLKKILFQNK